MDKNQLAALDQAATQELLPCPFCGSEPFIDDDTCGHSVVCCHNLECLAQGPFKPGDDQAIEGWNNRTGKLVLIDDGAVERVAEAILRETNKNEPEKRLYWSDAEHFATAALAALGVK
jgi:Lar family restriction alleviation protein